MGLLDRCVEKIEMTKEENGGMERLTARDGYGNTHYPYCFREDTCGGCRNPVDCIMCGFHKKKVERLAEYEETGLTPEQIHKMDRLYRAKCKEVSRYERGWSLLGDITRIIAALCKECKE